MQVQPTFLHKELLKGGFKNLQVLIIFQTKYYNRSAYFWHTLNQNPKMKCLLSQTAIIGSLLILIVTFYLNSFLHNIDNILQRLWTISKLAIIHLVHSITPNKVQTYLKNFCNSMSMNKVQNLLFPSLRMSQNQ